MYLDIWHDTRYVYDHPVFLEPQHLYFHPLLRHHYSLVDFSIQVSPEPNGLTPRIDAENNLYYQMWQHELTKELRISTHLKVHLSVLNPFDFLEEQHPKIDHQQALTPYLLKETISQASLEWVQARQRQSGADQASFLTDLLRAIHQEWEHEARYESDLHTPDQCFQRRKGSCRDLSWMLIQWLRHLDVPSRFVSGYSYNPELGEGHELHAWVEAWISGAGWMALDPSSGLLATEYYIPTCTSYKPSNTLPVQGTYRGDATSKLTTNVKIKLTEPL